MFDDGKNPRPKGNIGAADPSWVTAAIPSLVMVANNRDYWIRESNCRKQVCANVCMTLHVTELTVR